VLGDLAELEGDVKTFFNPTSGGIARPRFVLAPVSLCLRTYQIWTHCRVNPAFAQRIGPSIRVMPLNRPRKNTLTPSFVPPVTNRSPAIRA
jgi:hypothetical protein